MSVVLVTGFNNWGKTTLINKLFLPDPDKNRKNFRWDKTYNIEGLNDIHFIVESHSNDDWNPKKYLENWKMRILKVNNHNKKLSKKNKKFKKKFHLFGALCPTRISDSSKKKKNNDCQKLLKKFPFSKHKEIHLLHLVRKWDHHAELRIKEIERHLEDDERIFHHYINADFNVNGDDERLNARCAQAIKILRKIFQ